MNRDEHPDYELPHYSIEQANMRYYAMAMMKYSTGLDIPIPLDAEITYVDEGSVLYIKRLRISQWQRKLLP